MVFFSTKPFAAVTNRPAGRSPGGMFVGDERSEEVCRLREVRRGARPLRWRRRQFFSEMGAPSIRNIAILGICGGTWGRGGEGGDSALGGRGGGGQGATHYQLPCPPCPIFIK